MIRRPVCLFSLLVFSGVALAQKPVKTVDLNEAVVSAKKGGAAQKGRIRQTSLLFRAGPDAIRLGWDSTYLLTRFPAQSTRRIVLHEIGARLAALDTSKFDLFLMLLQIRDTDTLFRAIQVQPQMWDAATSQLRVDVRDSIIVLQPEPFYLGYGFRAKPLDEPYSYPFFFTRGGDGTELRIRDGSWSFAKTRIPIYVFPFRIAYAEVGP